MSYRMYVYDMGIVDYYNGMMPLMDYIKLCSPKGRSDEGNYLTYRDLKSFLINCFMEVKSSSTAGWDGDIRGLDEIAISAIPRPTGMLPYKVLVFKQDNNGQSFMVSECKINISEDCKKGGCEWCPFLKEDINCSDLMGFFYESFDLVENLFEKALCENNVSLVNIDRNNEKSIIRPIKPDDKFDLNNYESL